MADDPIDELAKKGRALLGEDREREVRAKEREASATAREARVRLRASVSSFARWGRWLGGAGLGITLAVLVVKLAPPSWNSNDEGGDLATGAAMISAFAPLIFLRLLRPWLGERAIVREQAWVDSLPFRVVGYLDALAQARTEGQASLTLHFTTAPDDETLVALFRIIGGTLGASKTQQTRLIEYAADFGDTSASTNAHLAAWVHRAVDMLIPLHARHPLHEVHVCGFS